MKKSLLLLLCLLLLPSICWGLGPFLNLGGSWTPANPTGSGVRPAHWFKADGGTNCQFTTGASVYALADGDVVGWATQYGTVAISGVSNPTTANKPILRTNVKNGKPVWRFNSTANILQSGVIATLAQPFTVFAVAAEDATQIADGAYRLILSSFLGTNDMEVGKSNGNNFYMYGGTALSDGAMNANWTIWTTVFNGLSSGMYLSGVLAISGQAGAANIQCITIGGYKTGSFLFKGDIAEILIYPGALSTADKNQVGQYLSKKYAITYTNIP